MGEGRDAGAARSARHTRRDLVAASLLLLLWSGVVALVDPRGDFPLNDDWSYAEAAQTLAREGRLELGRWTSMPLVVHVAWGALWSRAIDASFTTLRIATLVAGGLGALVFFALLRTLGSPRRVAVLAAAALAGNPLYVALAHTFMTDVPFAVVSAAALGLALRGLRDGDLRWLVAAFAAALAAAGIRQLALALPIAFGAAWCVRQERAPRRGARVVAIALLPTLVMAAALLGYEAMLAHTTGVPEFYHGQNASLLDALGDLARGRLGVLAGAAARLVTALLEIGLLLLPLAPLAASAMARTLGGRALALRVAALASGLAGVAAATGQWIPRGRNVLENLGVGPRTLAAAPPAPPDWLPVALTLAAAAAAATLVVAVLHRLANALHGYREGQCARAAATTLLAGSALVYLAPLVLTYGPFFDRYLLLPAIALAALALQGPCPVTRRAWRTAAVACGALLATSAVATHDYLAWNRARWVAIERLQTRYGATRAEIDGGFEFNYPNGPDSGLLDDAEVATRRYRVAFGLLPGYRRLESVAVASWSPFESRALLLLVRGEDAARPPSGMNNPG